MKYIKLFEEYTKEGILMTVALSIATVVLIFKLLIAKLKWDDKRANKDMIRFLVAWMSNYDKVDGEKRLMVYPDSYILDVSDETRDVRVKIFKNDYRMLFIMGERDAEIQLTKKEFDKLEELILKEYNKQ